jgi:hypothetical protein
MTGFGILMLIRAVVQEATLSVIAVGVALLLQLWGVVQDCGDFMLLVTAPVTAVALAGSYLNLDQIKSVVKE